MQRYKKYFSEDFYDLVKPKTKDIKHLLGDDMMIIAGDFYGIQKFIFENLGTKYAAKVLRAKSAFVQIFTQYIAKYICHKLAIDTDHIISTSAGKFEILSPILNSKIMDDIQNSINEYFIKNFYGLSGTNIVIMNCGKEDFEIPEKYKALREALSLKNENKKFHKFDLQKLDNFILSYDKDITNNTLCKICNMRKVMDEKNEQKSSCFICDCFKKLGERLVKSKNNELLSSEKLGLCIEDFSIDIVLNEKIKSYVLTKDNEICDFEYIANQSCNDLKTGLKALGILKADIDGMGNFIKNSDVTENFENFDMFSKGIDNFFSLYIPSIMKKDFQNTYTIFAGGDDLFLVGAWDEILKLSRRIKKDFQKFINTDLTISFGITIAKPNKPISFLANYSEELLESSKSIDEDKNAITLFDETVKWDKYLKTFDILQEEFKVLPKNDETTSFLYRLLDLIDMAKKVKLESDIKSTIWRSKLNYTFHRNLDCEKYKNLLVTLNSEIEQNPQEVKIFLCEYIYKRRNIK